MNYLFKRFQTPLLVFMLLVSALSMFGQPSNNIIKGAITPSPNAASLGKYGDIPVSYFTGTATAAVPIGTVQEGSLSMPVSLSYHTGGIKVGEQSSWVGLGFSLQAGGMITRVIQGVADDDVTKLGYYHNGSTLQLSGAQTTTQMVECGKGIRDAERDIFSANFNGNSAKFYFDKDKICRFVERKDWLVTPIIEALEFKGFVITVEDGRCQRALFLLIVMVKLLKPFLNMYLIMSVERKLQLRIFLFRQI